MFITSTTVYFSDDSEAKHPNTWIVLVKREQLNPVLLVWFLAVFFVILFFLVTINILSSFMEFYLSFLMHISSICFTREICPLLPIRRIQFVFSVDNDYESPASLRIVGVLSLILRNDPGTIIVIKIFYDTFFVFFVFFSNFLSSFF